MTEPAQRPDVALFERRYGINGPAKRVARQLHGLLVAATEPLDPEEAVRRLVALWAWVLAGRGEVSLFGNDGAAEARCARLRFLLSVLEREVTFGEPLRARLTEVVSHASVVPLLCSSGLPLESGFLGELRTRLAATLLPDPPAPADLSRPLSRLFRKEGDVQWLRELPEDLVSRLQAALFEEAACAALIVQRRRAMAIVSTRVAALGLAEDVTSRAGDDPQAPFLGLCAGYAESAPDTAEGARWVEACRAKCRRVLEHLDEYGVSTDLVFRLESIGHGLGRLEALERVPAASLLATVLVDAHRQRSIRDLIRSNSRQLARKIAERSGDTGDHYITRTRKEWLAMLASAGGGGVLTAGTTWLKYTVGWMALPLFFEGAFNTANYALSFLVMHALGFTLATKQPSMTAAAIAAALRRDRGAGPARHEAVVEMVARVSRSQLAAVLGNLGLVIPTCIAADLLLTHLRGQSFFDAYAGSYVVQSLHPLQSGTLPFAVLTGVLLWLSSMVAGWLDNWVAYRRMPEAMGESGRLQGLFGVRGAHWLGRMVGRWAAPFGSCVSLGTFLALMPMLSRIFGAPLDVRHVTLSTGGLTFAFRGMGLEQFVAEGGLAALVGIAVIGLCNFGVSFACALVVAVRAREVPWREDLRLVWALVRALLTRPGQFLFPPAAPAQAPESGAPLSPPGH